ncbi:MAG TPA: CPBP family intramembrane glutamic endopeptidase [Planctomycetota bacterium]|nr:CPBP family intramembrane glutamic endopeptidase [Planctomycetota bacterium]
MDAANCVACGRPLKPEAAFCSACGHRRGDPTVDRAALARARAEKLRRIESGWSGIRSVILLYLLLLGGIGLTFLVRNASDEFTAEVVGCAAIGGIVIVAALLDREALKNCTRSAGFSWRGYAALFIASIPIVLVVHAYVGGVHRLFRLRPGPELSAFTGRGPAWAFLLYAVSPAIFEELGFRGVIFGLLRRSLDPRESILLSGAAFGILHLSVPSLITHVPLGLYLGWLRHRSGSLYPSMAAHFLHNALVVAGTTWSLLPGS